MVKTKVQETITKIEEIINPYAKKADLPTDYSNYIANMIIEDPPRSGDDLNDLIGEFFTNNRAQEEAKEIVETCNQIFKKLSKSELINPESSTKWVAEKLDTPLLMADIELITDKEYHDGYTETAFNYEEFNFGFSGGVEELKDDMAEKKRKKMEEKLKKETDRKKKKETEAYERHQRTMNEMRKTMPKIQVMHNKAGAIDINLDQVDLEVPGKVLLNQAEFKLGHGRRYGLIGRNGIGKTTLLYAICRKEFKGLENAPQILLVEQEVKGDSYSVIDTILKTDKERWDLIEKEKQLLAENGEGEITEENEQLLTEIYKRLDEINAVGQESKARKLLFGLGFTAQMQEQPTQHLSGGWRMRLALARVLFCEPEILMLDEPTNHLDLDAVMWLQDYLIQWDKTILVVSHAREFLNNVCTDIIHYDDQKLTYYKGGYDEFERLRSEKITQSKKEYETQQKKMSHVQDFIDRFRCNAKRSTLVQSRIKYLNRLEKVEQVFDDPTTVFMFDNPEKLRPPIVRLDEGEFGYTEDTTLLRDLTFSLEMQSKVAILGANGVGKTTLLKMLMGEFESRKGEFYKNPRAQIALFSQHHVEHLNVTLSPFEFFTSQFPLATTESIRTHLSNFGVTGNLCIRPIYLLSGGQKARVALAMTAWGNPHVMIMDEPTNHLDIDAVDALIVALSNYNGGLIIVSHDQYFVSCICDQIWYIKDTKLKRFNGDFDEYRKALSVNRL